MSLSKEESLRYARHLSLPQFGEEAQEKLKNARVLVVGTGGLGAPLLQYLSAAGVGHIGLMDFDYIDHTNLQRQVLFSTSDVGKEKVTVAVEKLRDQNPYIEFKAYNEPLTSENAMEIIAEYDIVADGTDNFPTRYLVNDVCVLLGKTNVYASIFQFEGQVSIFNHKGGDDYGPNYRDLFPSPPPPGMVPSCAEGGVLGVLPGIVGSLQALEVIKVITGIGKPLVGKLLLVNTLDYSFRTVNVRKDPENPLTGPNPEITAPIDYEEFCGLKELMKGVPEITVEQLHERMNAGDTPVLIDVREPWEHEAANIKGKLIPLGEVEDHISDFPRQGDVVIYCRSGRRSAETVQLFHDKYGYTNLYNLKGGMLAWKDAFDPTMNVS